MFDGKCTKNNLIQLCCARDLRHFRWAAGAGQRGKETPDTLDETLPSLEQIHLPRQCASECAGMGLSVEGAAKSLHLPRLHALQATSEGVSVEGDFD